MEPVVVSEEEFAAITAKNQVNAAGNIAAITAKNQVNTANTCEKCGKQYMRAYGLKKHSETCNGAAAPLPKKLLPCGYCKKEFKTKKELTAHLKGCEFQGDAEVIVEPELELARVDPVAAALKLDLRVMMSRFEESLRSGGEVGEKAQNTILLLLILRLLQPHFKSGEINILDLNLEKWRFNPRQLRPENVKYVVFDELLKLEGGAIGDEFASVWKLALAVHPVTSMIFNDKNIVEIQHDKLRTIIKDLNEFKFEQMNADHLADVYQYYIHKQFNGENGSKLGQFFTPVSVVHYIVGLASEYFYDGAKYLDPFLGVGGFISAVYDECKHRGFVDMDKFYGTEIASSTHKYALASLLIRSGKIYSTLLHSSAFAKIPQTAEKYDIIVSNPPFGKTFNDEDLNGWWFTTHKVKAKEPVCLSYIFGRLNPGGRAFVVWPYGGAMNSANKSMMSVRQDLMENGQILKVIELPRKIFDYTSIATCILVFRRRAEGEKPVLDEVVEFGSLDAKLNYTQKLTITLETAMKKRYSWKCSDYIEREQITGYTCEMKKIGDVCTILNGKNLKRELIVAGPYPVIGGGTTPTGYHSEFNRDENTTLISSSGTCGYVSRYSTKIWASDCLSLRPIDSGILDNDFLYAVVKNMLQDALCKLGEGTAIKHVKADDAKELQIPIPPIEIQREIAAFVLGLENSKKMYMADAEKFRGEINDVLLYKLIPKDPEMRKIGEICTLNRGKILSVDQLKHGEYPVIGGGTEPMGYHTEFNTESNTPLISNMGNQAGFVSRYSSKTFATNVCCKLEQIHESLIKEYVYYVLKHSLQKDIFKLQHGVAQPGISNLDISNIDFPIVDLELQQQIVAQLDKNEQRADNLIELSKCIDEQIANYLAKKLNNVENTNQNPPCQNTAENIE